MFPKVSDFHDNEDDIVCEDGVKDILELIVTKIKVFIQNEENKGHPKRHKVALSILKLLD